MPDDASRNQDLMGTGAAAAAAGVTRQAVLQAIAAGRLRVAGRGPNREYLLGRQDVLAWAGTVTKQGRRSGERARAPSRRASPSAATPPAPATPQGATRASSPAAARPDGGIPAEVLDSLFGKAAVPEVLEQFKLVLLDDVANRRASAGVAKERVDVERMKVQLDRRRLERELRHEERDNNVEQLLARVKPRAAADGISGNGLNILLGLCRRVLEALSEDIVAELARGGTVVEDAYARAMASWRAWAKTKGLATNDVTAHEELVPIWVAEMMRQLKAAETPAAPQPNRPEPPPSST